MLATVLQERGLRIVSGGTDCHMFLVDLRAKKITGKDAEAALSAARTSPCNKNAIPNDPEKPFVTSGIRLGSPAITTRGFTEIECEELAHLIADVLDAPDDDAAHRARAREAWRALTQQVSGLPAVTLATRAVDRAPRDEVPVLRQRRHAGHRLARVRARRLDPPPPPLRRLPEALHHLRDRRAAAAAGREDQRHPLRLRRRRRSASASSARCTSGRCPPSTSTRRSTASSQQVLALGEREIPSRQIGEMVMQELLQARQGRLHPLRVRLPHVPGRLRLPRRAEGSRGAAAARPAARR